jgi:hypothetical protein
MAGTLCPLTLVSAIEEEVSFRPRVRDLLWRPCLDCSVTFSLNPNPLPVVGTHLFERAFVVVGVPPLTRARFSKRYPFDSPSEN